MAANEKKDHLSEAIRLLAAVLLAFGLIVAGFYAKSHHVDDQYFFYGAGLVVIVIIVDYI